MPHGEDQQGRILKYNNICDIKSNGLLQSARQQLSPNRAVKNTARLANKFSHTCDGGWSSHQFTVFDTITRKAQHYKKSTALHMEFPKSLTRTRATAEN